MKNKQRGFVDGLSLIILIVSYMTIKITADELGKPKGDGPHYTETAYTDAEQNYQHRQMTESDFKFREMKKK